MEPEYKNWIPKEMIYGFGAGTAALAAGAVVAGATDHKKLAAALGVGAVAGGAATGWLAYAHNQFSYDGERKLSKEIIEGVAQYVHIPEGGVGLDVGCGSGALTIACAKLNPQGRMVGVDCWGPEYASYSQSLCEHNAEAEGVSNVSFRPGDANKLEFADEAFDVVTSNYVYHNIAGADKQALLLETLRVLKKGGTFALHDLMSPWRFGDMQEFTEKLRAMGYEDVGLINTANGMFMEPTEAAFMMLSGSTLLVGRK